MIKGPLYLIMKSFFLPTFSICLLLTTCNCNKVEETTLNRSDFSFLSLPDEYKEIKKINWPNIFEQEQSDYFAYVYSDTCYYCNKIKNQIIEFSQKFESFYFVEFNDQIPIKSEYKNNIGKSTIDELFIQGTPTLFVIQNKVIENCLCGYNEIANYISSYKYESN